MSRKLEALEHIYYGSQGYGETDKYYKYLKNYLQSIDNANPSEALECLENFELDLDLTLDGTLDRRFINGKSYEEILDTIKQSLLKSQEQEKMLKVIINKNVNVASLKAYDLEEYNMVYENKLTQEEFDLLKRYCEEKEKWKQQ